MDIIDGEFPLIFQESDYNRYLGLYQKWLSGNKDQTIDRLYSFSAFHLYEPNIGFASNVVRHGYQKYAEYLYLTVTSLIDNTPDWINRIYIDESLLNPMNPDSHIWKTKLNLLMQYPQVQIICVKFPRYYIKEYNCHKELLAVMFRYLALFDKNVSVILFRDIDNIYTDQHHHFTNKWLELGTDICFYMNDRYKRQLICDLTPNGLVFDKNKFYTIILSGIWNIKKPMNFVFSYSVWQKLFAYIEEATNFAYDDKYIGYKHHKSRFIYGFDELTLTRVLLPIFLQMDLTIYTIPVKIFDSEFIINMFENPMLYKFLMNLTDASTLKIIKNITVNKYWDLSSPTSGLAQYILCILTNIYFGIIMKKSKFYTSETFISDIKHKIIPNTLLMAIGVFTFKNYDKYNWYTIPDNIYRKDQKYKCGADVVKKFLQTNEKITLEEWTAGTVPSPVLNTIKTSTSKGIENYKI